MPVLHIIVPIVVTACATIHLPAAENTPPKVTSETLRNDQLAISGRYDRFERLLSQMADLLSHEDPARAELLRRTISKGREHAISDQLGTIARNLDQNNLGTATEQQETVLESLNVLLQLLQSEDRRSELEKERERINQLLKDVSNTLSRQKSAHAQTRNAAAPAEAAGDQKGALDQTDEILQAMRDHDSTKQPEAEQESTDPGTEQSASAGSQPAENKSDQQAEWGQQAPKNPDQQSSGSPQDTPQSSPSSPGSGEDSPPSQKSNQTPGRTQVAQARDHMQQAMEQLQKQLRDKAMQQQDAAIRQLQKAVEQLRKQLLQLREEEKEMILASLEARFQRMLMLQTQVCDETIDLSSTPTEEWLDTMFARCRQVSQRQSEIQVECDQTLGLLQEDGTSVAIVLSVEDISADMRTVAHRLRESKVGSLTQGVQTDIVEALRELIEATQSEMQEMKSGENPESPPSLAQKKPALVQLIAELKVLRSLQHRINRRTDRIDTLLTEEVADSHRDLLQQLEELTRRQQRLVESAAELGQRLAR